MEKPKEVYRAAVAEAMSQLAFISMLLTTRLGAKFEDHAAHGVREYWLIDPLRLTVEQFRLDEEFMAFDAVGNFHLTDTITALTVPGFTIPVQAIFEPEANQAALREHLS